MQEIQKKLINSGLLLNNNSIAKLKLINWTYNYIANSNGTITLTEFDNETQKEKPIFHSIFDDNTKKLKFISI